MSFGRKGMTGESGANSAAPFGNPGLPPSDLPVDDVAAKREAFLASERSRKASQRAAIAASPLATAKRERPSGPQRNMWEPGGVSARAKTDVGGFTLFGPLEKRHIVLAYVLWYFLGVLSMHRIYCGSKETAAYQFGLFVCAAFFSGFWPPLGTVLLGLWGLWFVADLFLIPRMLRRHKLQGRHSATKDFG